MKIINQEHKTVPIDTIKPHPQNPREGDIGAIHTSITKNGFYGAIIVQKSTGHVLAGNHRLAAAQQAGATEIPAIIVDVDNETALKILLADNRTNDLASYDGYTLAQVLQEIAESSDLEGTGYDTDDLDQLLEDIGKISAIEFPELPTGDKEPFQQITFTLHDDQAAIVEEAIKKAKAAGEFNTPNENANGNALARIAETYLHG